jgi:signal transduction histidine kinase
LGKLFQDLLTSAKAEDGRLQNHPVVIELGGFLERIADDLRLIAEKKGLVVEYIIGIENPQNIKSNTIGGQKMIKPLYYVYADVERLSEVLVNLTDNAVKYTENGKITVSLTGNDSIVQIRVQDSGIGIPSEDIPHLFEKFYRVDTTATRTINGTGLGLYICRKIIELYNGRIWVDSKLGKGSTFYINLPRISSKTAQELQLKEDVENLPVGVSQSNKM